MTLNNKTLSNSWKWNLFKSLFFQESCHFDFSPLTNIKKWILVQKQKHAHYRKSVFMCILCVWMAFFIYYWIYRLNRIISIIKPLKTSLVYANKYSRETWHLLQTQAYFVIMGTFKSVLCVSKCHLDRQLTIGETERCELTPLKSRPLSSMRGSGNVDYGDGWEVILSSNIDTE